MADGQRTGHLRNKWKLVNPSAGALHADRRRTGDSRWVICRNSQLCNRIQRIKNGVPADDRVLKNTEPVKPKIGFIIHVLLRVVPSLTLSVYGNKEGQSRVACFFHGSVLSCKITDRAYTEFPAPPFFTGTAPSGCCFSIGEIILLFIFKMEKSLYIFISFLCFYIFCLMIRYRFGYTSCKESKRCKRYRSP